jgi:hypothetical protein
MAPFRRLRSAVPLETLMKLGYQQATIGFCVDLTSPTSEVTPIANLLVGEVEGRQVAGLALIIPEHLDPLTKAVLSDTHQLVRRYVDEAFKCRPPAAPLRMCSPASTTRCVTACT